ncbi:hypothetical protein HBE96_17860 [Clostridium sp. P21]|uniref:Uncharacterized protein n=1 Tax=Clostridium muellerianum TaxID=2716538 RepID=A0A7Y0HPQ8_9CLOT|nr:hypothetical protein [Clostridium muellerianum]NMM64485.1 hypothetical protein [Clostridium muellerianum]
MLGSDMYMLVGEDCPAYNSLYEAKNNKAEFVSCITCENFKSGVCSLNYYDIVAMNVKK